MKKNNNPLMQNDALSALRNRLRAASPEGQSQSSANIADGVEIMANYLRKAGGYVQQDRMIADKRKTLDRAMKYSYQGAVISKVSNPVDEDSEMVAIGEPAHAQSVRALININRLKEDYDDKILSVPFEYGFKVGDVFLWENTNTHWLIYLQDLTELAYFRGDIRKCIYEISFKDADGEVKKIHAAIKGPTEAKLGHLEDNGIVVDLPANTLRLMVPNSPDTIDAFQRYDKFFLNTTGSNTPTPWRIEAVDAVSMPGVLEVLAVEHYYNKDKDDAESGVFDGLIVDPVNPNEEEVEITIVGESFIRPKKEYTYTFNGVSTKEWVIETEYPLEREIVDERTIKIKWLSSLSGKFTLSYGEFTKVITAKSLF